MTTAKNGPSAQTMELSLMSYGHALEQFYLALELNSTDIEARQKRAIVLGRLGKNNEARGLFEKLLDEIKNQDAKAVAET